MGGEDTSARRSANERIARLHEVTSALSESLTPDQVADVVVHQGVAALGARAGSLAMLLPGADSLALLASTGYSEERVQPWRSFSIAAPAPLAECARTGNLVLLESRAARDERYPSLAGITTWDQAWAAVPLIVDGRVIGALGLSFSEPHAFDADEQSFMLALAHQCAQALDRARLFEAERNARAAAEVAQGRLAFLVEVGSILSSSLDYGTTLANIARLATPILADWCVIDLVEENGGTQRVATAHADPAKERLVAQLLRFPPNLALDTLVARALRSGETILLNEPPADLCAGGAADPEWLAIVGALGCQALLIVPLRARDQVIGSIAFVVAESGWRYGTADVLLAEELARRASAAIDNARLYAEARAAVRARDDLLSMVSHDLRNPLTVIKAQANLLARRLGRAGPVDLPGMRAGFERIDAEVVKMSKLIGELLDFAQIQVGLPLVLDLYAVDLVALAHRVVAERQPAAEHHQLRVETEAPALVGKWDAIRLERVLDNLVSNAIKYSPSGGEVLVSLARAEQAGRAWAVLTVRDQGIGIPAADLPRVFDRFYRAGNVAHGIGGTGIGLMSVRTIVEQHGGSISVASQEGQGSAFTVRLPLDE